MCPTAGRVRKGRGRKASGPDCHPEGAQAKWRPWRETETGSAGLRDHPTQKAHPFHGCTVCSCPCPGKQSLPQGVQTNFSNKVIDPQTGREPSSACPTLSSSIV